MDGCLRLALLGAHVLGGDIPLQRHGTRGKEISKASKGDPVIAFSFRRTVLHQRYAQGYYCGHHGISTDEMKCTAFICKS